MYLPWLDEQWASDCRNGAELWRRLTARGFRGSLRVVGEWATRRRRAEKADAENLQRIPSARTIARLMTIGRDTLSKAETVTVAAIEAGVTERLEAEIAQRRELLTAREREVLENHLQAEIAAAIQRLLQDADRKVVAINAELYKRPTSTGVRFRLEWQPLPEGIGGAPVGLAAARKRLLNTNADLWSPEDRSVVGAMLQERINIERANTDSATGGSLLDQLSRALDYRHWHRFTVQRWQDKQWVKLSGPASSGERALGLTVPLFAAVASFYSQSGTPHSPRLVLLDEVFAGIDDAARVHCMALIREFDLDFVVTSEREWGCYAELPGVSICHLQRLENIDAIHVSRWTWDGRAKQRESDPNRRFADA